MNAPADPAQNRAARHLALPQISADGQARIARGKVLLIGAGGIGNAAAAYLVAAGVGELVVADFDRVDDSNLGRQFLFGPGDVGRQKTDVLREQLGSINPDVSIATETRRVGADNIDELLASVDLVLDGSDNFATRFVVSDGAVRQKMPLVVGSAIRLEGQVAVFGPDYENGASYRCAYSEGDESLDSCAGNGVLSPVPGVVGTLMAVEALKLLAGLPVERDRLLLFDAATLEFRTLRVAKRADCPACR